MIEHATSASPVSPSLPTTLDGASGIGSRGGDVAVKRAPRWCDIGDELYPGEAVEGTFDAEDVQPQQVLTTPEQPPREVIEQHRIDHWPYRCWCDECVEGFGRERKHGTRS